MCAGGSRRREGSSAVFFQCGKNRQPRILNPAKLSFREKGEIKTLLAEARLRELVTRPTQKE